MTHLLDRLRHHVSGAIERGEAEAITAVEVDDKTPEHGVECFLIDHCADGWTGYMIVAASAGVQRREGKPAFEAFAPGNKSLGAYSTYDAARVAIDMDM